MKKPYEMSASEWSNALSQRLIERFGKDTFTKEELTKDFWVDFNINCHEFFESEDGSINQYEMLGSRIAQWLLCPDKNKFVYNPDLEY